MKNLNLPLYKFVFCLLISAMLQSCVTMDAKVQKNDQIKPGIASDLHELNDEVFATLKAGDYKKLENYLSKEMLTYGAPSRFGERVYNALKANEYQRFAEYYVVNKYIKADTITERAGLNGYQLIYPGSAQEMYFTLMVPKDNKLPNKKMITAQYSKLDYGWKLDKLDVALYTINGKTAPELFELAKKENKQGYLFSAANTLQLATSCARPNEFWLYNVEAPLYKFADSVRNEANEQFKLPLTLSQLSSKPQLISLFNNTTAEGTYPTLCYISKINLADEAGLKRENDEVKKIIGTVLPGINKNKRYLSYTIYNEKPSSIKNIRSYVITDKLE